jgi:hypothetical protein
MTKSMPIDTGLRRRTALLVFATLQLLDFLTTMAIFSRGGSELNPVVRSLMPWTGPAVAVLLSKVSIVFLTWRLSRRPWIVNAGNVFYGLVVVWNGAQVFSIFA